MFSNLFSKSETRAAVPWTRLTELSQLDELVQESHHKPVLIFKHSTSCPISSMSLSRFERSFNEEATFDCYFLDLLAHREVSNQVAERFQVRHESPQAILISKGKVIFDASHSGIDFEEVNNHSTNA